MAVVGIDLGTTNSVLATVREGQVTVVPDIQGRHLHPSVVSFAEDASRAFSHEAVAKRIDAPLHTVYSAKRLIGLPFRSEAVRFAATRLPYELVEGDNEQAVFAGPDRNYAIPEISGIFLSYLRQCCEFFLGEAVTGAVITVPANFNDAQRRATMDAGRIAGLDVMRILNEPTAAALAYGIGQNTSKRVAVYDLGGGTFDITILQVDGDVFEVMASGGDSFLGGDDIDVALADVLADQCIRQTGIDPRQHRGVRSRLTLAAEQVKRHLSKKTSARGELKQLVMDNGREINLRFEVTRDQLEHAAAPLLKRSLETCESVLRDAGISVSQIDEVILVGGSTRTPAVRQAVQGYFNRVPRTDLNPDEVVAWGAAIQADNLAHGSGDMAGRAVLLDVTPRGLGIAVAGGFAETIIERNVAVPVEQSRLFSTSANNQSTVRIQVCQGEEKMFDENYPLGDLELNNIREAPRGEVTIEVTFMVDANGIMTVRAKDTDSGAEQEAQVNVRGSMSAQEISDAIGDETPDEDDDDFGIDLPAAM